MKRKGPFLEEKRTVKYENKWMRVEEATVLRPDKTSGIFGLVYMNPGTTVVAINDKMEVLTVREYKYALSKETIELISGGIDEGETPEEAGIRELREETGYSARKITYLGCIDPFTSVINSANHIILAQDLVYEPVDYLADDIVSLQKIPFHDALKMLENGEITHAASCTGLLLADKVLGAEHSD